MLTIIRLSPLLTLILAICKLAGILVAPWWLVFLPLTVGFGLLVAIILFFIWLAKP